MPTLQDMLKGTAPGQDNKDSHGDGSAALPGTGHPDSIENTGPAPATGGLMGLKLGGLGGGFKLKVPPVAPAPEPDTSGTDSDTGMVEESEPVAEVEIPTTVPETVSAGLTLQGLANLETPEVGIPGIEQDGVDPSDSAGYLDQVPATAPVRDLPTELDKQQKAFIDSLDSIYRLHDDPEMFVNMVRKIMSEMQDRPELCVLLAASKGQDSNAIIRGLRQSAGMAQVKKQESKAKRGGAKAKPQSAQVDSVMQSLQGLAGFDGGFD